MSESAGKGPAVPVLYSFRRCPYAMRARLAIYAAGKQVELREVVLRDKPTHMITLSPKATVPVLWLPGGRVIEESLEVIAWALPDAAHNQTKVDSEFVALIDTQFKHHLDRYKYASRYPEDDAMSHRAACAALLMRIEERLTGTARLPWLGGDDPGFADMAILPFVRQFASADAAWFATCRELPLVRAWLHRFLVWPGLQAVMKKYPPWREGTEGIAFGCSRPRNR